MGTLIPPELSAAWARIDALKLGAAHHRKKSTARMLISFACGVAVGITVMLITSCAQPRPVALVDAKISAHTAKRYLPATFIKNCMEDGGVIPTDCCLEWATENCYMSLIK